MTMIYTQQYTCKLAAVGGDAAALPHRIAPVDC
jgi:hypothetical protein